MAEDLENYLKEIKFEKQFEKLCKKLKNKKVVVYGTGLLFQLINSKYDLKKLNIIGVSDGKYSPVSEREDCLGYKIIHATNIVKNNPDYVLVSVLRYLDVIESLEDTYFKDSKIKVIPFAKYPLLKALKNIWS